MQFFPKILRHFWTNPTADLIIKEISENAYLRKEKSRILFVKLTFHFLCFAEEAVSLFCKVSFQFAGSGSAEAFFGGTLSFQLRHFASFL